MPKEKKRTIKFLRGASKSENGKKSFGRKKPKKEEEMIVEDFESVIPLRNNAKSEKR